MCSCADARIARELSQTRSNNAARSGRSSCRTWLVACARWTVRGCPRSRRGLAANGPGERTSGPPAARRQSPCTEWSAAAERPALPPLTIQYKDFAAVQRAAPMSAHLDHWRRALDGYEDSLELSTAHTRQAKSGTRSARFVQRYSSEFAKALEQFSRRHNCTLFMALLAGLGVTL